MVISGKTALLSDIGDMDAFCNNLLRLTEDDLLREELSQYGWLYVKERFHYTRLINDMRQLYWELMEKNK